MQIDNKVIEDKITFNWLKGGIKAECMYIKKAKKHKELKFLQWF